MIHDEAIKELFKEYNKADKKHYTDTFYLQCLLLVGIVVCMYMQQ